MKTAKEIELYILADRENKILFIKKDVIKNICNLSSPEATSYFMFKAKFPNYMEVIVPSLGTIIED